MFEEGKYAGGETQAVVPRRVTAIERLQNEQEGLTKRLAEVKEALEILARNPDLQRLLDIIR